MKKIMYTNQEGLLCVVHPAPKSQLEYVLGPLTEQEYEEHVIERSIPKGVFFFKVDDEDLPRDRTLRDAWKLDENNKCIECPDKAREIVRQKRNDKLKDLDVLAITEARKPKGSLIKIDGKAEMLRGIPQRENFNTLSVDDLKAILVEIEGVK